MQRKLTVGVLFGGVSAEHEVSVITGLQVIEEIDRNLFDPLVIYLSQNGEFLYYPDLKHRKDFSKIRPVEVFIDRDKNGVFFKEKSTFGKKVYLKVAYLAFHGGNGESGQLQGLLEIFELPYTSPSTESSVITMNKVLTKEVLRENGISSLDGVGVKSLSIRDSIKSTSEEVSKVIGLPAIVKPAHLGSSIGINIAKNQVELQKFLLEASFIDDEVLVEKYIIGFKEYNCAVRLTNEKLEASEVEEPVKRDEFLSFADKYQRGGE